MCAIRPPLKGGAPHRPGNYYYFGMRAKYCQMFRFLCEISQVSNTCNGFKNTPHPHPHLPTENLNKTCSQTCHGPGITSLGPCLVISNLWCKPSHPPSFNQTVVIHFRCQRTAVECEMFRRIGRFT